MRFFNYLFIVYFSLGACFPRNDFSQLLKINDLLEHYELHQKEANALGETITFTEFILLHFSNADGHEHKNENGHDNLPLKNFTTSMVLCLVNPLTLNTFYNPFIERSLPEFKSHYIQTIAFDIFHPPKNA